LTTCKTHPGINKSASDRIIRREAKLTVWLGQSAPTQAPLSTICLCICRGWVQGVGLNSLRATVVGRKRSGMMYLSSPHAEIGYIIHTFPYFSLGREVSVPCIVLLSDVDTSALAHTRQYPSSKYPSSNIAQSSSGKLSTTSFSLSRHSSSSRRPRLVTRSRSVDRSPPSTSGN
jgi:hypothetical protein